MGPIITVVMTIVTIVVGFIVFQGLETQMTTDNVTMPASAEAMISILPFILGAVLILGMFASIGAVSNYVRVKKWRDFGGRMKEAYTAKFGYPNPGFEQEVDQHIKAMEALGHGDTKSINESWLRRMATFVEIPYIIPEEELLSEVEKTTQYDPDK